MLCIEINRTLNAKPVKPLPIYMVKTLGGGGVEIYIIKMICNKDHFNLNKMKLSPGFLCISIQFIMKIIVVL